MRLKTMKALSGVILVTSLLMVSVHGGQIQRIPPLLQENPTTVNKDFAVGLNKDITIPVGFFPQIPSLPEACTQNGIFPVTDTCDQYYTCEDSTGDGWEWSVNWFTCPEGMLFNVDSKVCTLASSVASRPECQKEEEELHGENFEVAAYSEVDEGILKRRKRRAGATNDIVKQSEETCVVISNIDAYIRHIKSKGPLTLTSTNNKGYNTVLTGYNSDLVKAQRNCDAWRTSNGVYDKLYATYELIKKFGPELNAKFEDHQTRMKFLSSPLLPDISKMEKQIKTIKERILNTNKVITALDSKHEALDSLRTSLKSYEQELRLLKADENRQKILKELQELKKFFEYIKNNANEIRNDALGAKVKMEDFKKHMGQDSYAFNRQTESAHKLMNVLKTQQTKNNAQLTSYQKDIASRQREIQNGNSQLSHTKRERDQAHSKLQSIDREIAKKKRDAQTRVDVGAGVLAIPIFGWIAGGILLGTGVADLNALNQRRKSTKEYYDRMINSYNSQLTLIQNGIAADQRMVSSLQQNSRIIESELSTIVKLNRDLQYVKDNVNSIMPLLNKSVDGLEKIQTYFSGAVGNLALFIAEVEKVREGTEAEAKNALSFGYNSISTMKSYWDDANDQILELGKCS